MNVQDSMKDKWRMPPNCVLQFSLVRVALTASRVALGRNVLAYDLQPFLAVFYGPRSTKDSPSYVKILRYDKNRLVAVAAVRNKIIH